MWKQVSSSPIPYVAASFPLIVDFITTKGRREIFTFPITRVHNRVGSYPSIINLKLIRQLPQPRTILFECIEYIYQVKALSQNPSTKRVSEVTGQQKQQIILIMYICCKSKHAMLPYLINYILLLLYSVSVIIWSWSTTPYVSLNNFDSSHTPAHISAHQSCK